jgi:hypothetical protein
MRPKKIEADEYCIFKLLQVNKKLVIFPREHYLGFWGDSMKV